MIRRQRQMCIRDRCSPDLVRMEAGTRSALMGICTRARFRESVVVSALHNILVKANFVVVVEHVKRL